MILKGNEAKERLLEGINQTADIVRLTIGAKGRNVMLLDQMRMINHVTKDGVSVANKIHFEDNILEAGSQLLKNAADKTVQEVGDGTSTTSILTQTMCNKFKNEIDLGKDVHSLINDLKDDLSAVNDFIVSKSNKIEKLSQIEDIALVSSNSDVEISGMIRDIHRDIGFDGIIDVRENDSTETRYDIVRGLTIENTGYSTHLFVNDQDKNRVELSDAKVIVLNGKLSELSEALMNLINQNSSENTDAKPLVLMVHNIEESILKQILASLSRGFIKNVVVVETNLIYQNRADRFKDASVFLNAEYIDTNNKIGNPGYCEKVIIEKDSVTFINGAGNISEHLKMLKESKELTSDLKHRIFSLESKAAVLWVGGKFQNEIRERYDRVEDAVLAVKTAINSGFCAGGASTFLFARKELNLKTEIMKEALYSCYEQIMLNANKKADYYIREIEDKGYGYGFNVVTGKVENLLEKGIVDSTKVLEVSLENAVKTSGIFSLIEAVVE